MIGSSLWGLRRGMRYSIGYAHKWLLWGKVKNSFPSSALCASDCCYEHCSALAKLIEQNGLLNSRIVCRVGHFCSITRRSSYSKTLDCVVMKDFGEPNPNPKCKVLRAGTSWDGELTSSHHHSAPILVIWRVWDWHIFRSCLWWLFSYIPETAQTTNGQDYQLCIEILRVERMAIDQYRVSCFGSCNVYNLYVCCMDCAFWHSSHSYIPVSDKLDCFH